MTTLSHIISLCLTISIAYAEEIRFCSVGMGTFGTATAKYAIQKGFKMVAAFTRYSKHTKTVGQLLGMEDDESLKFQVSGMNKFEEILDKTKPHFCIDATNSTLSDVFPHFRRLIEKGVNIVTLTNEAIFPNTRFNWKPRQLYKTLNKMAQEKNVVILGGGFQDSILMPVVPSMTAAMLELNTVRIEWLLDIDGYGEKAATYYGVGMKEEDFKGYTQNETFSMEFYLRAVVEAMADQMGYPLLDMVETLETGSSITNGKRQNTIQLFTRKECYKPGDGINSNALGRVIGNDECGGVNITIKGVATENVQIFLSVVLGVVPNVNDINDVEVRLEGRPNMEFSIKNVDGEIITAASLLHRVPQVLNELEPGFHEVSKLRQNRYFRKVEDWSNVNNDDDVDNKDDKTADKQDL